MVTIIKTRKDRKIDVFTGVVERPTCKRAGMRPKAYKTTSQEEKINAATSEAERKG
jgi:hypothetical protein